MPERLVAAEEGVGLAGEAGAAGAVVEVAVVLPDDDRRVDEALPVEQRAWLGLGLGLGLGLELGSSSVPG